MSRAAAREPSRFERTKWADLLFALPVVAWYVYTLALDFQPFAMLATEVMGGAADLATVANLLARIGSFAFSFLVILFLILRAPPVAKPRGIASKLCAVLGAFIGVSFLALPRAGESLAIDTVSALLIFGGSAYAIFAILFLGRSFSILPEARRLVTSGPFALMRHPVYFGEAIALVGIMLQFAQPWSGLLLAAQFAFQLARMSYEERVLGETFAGYAAYRARTARLIPGLY